MARSEDGENLMRQNSLKEEDKEENLTDQKKILVCPICCDPVGLFLFECQSGHVACRRCHTFHVGTKCLFCGSSIGGRTLDVFELESAKEFEPNKRNGNGCEEKEIIPFVKKHRCCCPYVPSSCPFSDCNCSESNLDLHKHMSDNHHDSILEFEFNKSFQITLDPPEKSLIRFLQEQNNPKLRFLLNLKISKYPCSIPFITLIPMPMSSEERDDIDIDIEVLFANPVTIPSEKLEEIFFKASEEEITSKEREKLSRYAHAWAPLDVKSLTPMDMSTVPPSTCSHAVHVILFPYPGFDDDLHSVDLDICIKQKGEPN